MAGTDTVRGINFQHCHAMLVALEVVASPDPLFMRVEGTDDVVDIEMFGPGGSPDGREGGDGLVLLRAIQVKSRVSGRRWSAGEVSDVLARWEALDPPPSASFEFITDGHLGPGAEDLRVALENHASELVVTQGPGSQLVGDSPAPTAPAVRIRADSAPIDRLLALVESEVAGQLAGTSSPAQVSVDALHATDRLFKAIALAAGSPDPAERLLSQEYLRHVVGGEGLLAPVDRWAGDLGDQYRHSISSFVDGELVRPRLVRTVRGEQRRDSVEPSDLLAEASPWIVAGPTGTGKSSALLSLRRAGGATTRTVVVCEAELYVAGALDRLVADSVSAVIGRSLARMVGRHVLNDPSTLVVIDGVSEMPGELREEIAAELLSISPDQSRAAIGIAGRDEGVMRSVLPRDRSGVVFSVAPFDYTQRRELARILTPSEAHLDSDVACSQIEHVLGDAAGVPILFRFALGLVHAGASFRDRTDIYEGTLSLLAASERGASPEVARAVLGLAFSRLLDEGRRFASPLEWSRLEQEAIERVAERFRGGDVEAVRSDYQTSGLVARIFKGQASSQVFVPLHDSLADYLAASAVSAGLIGLRTRLRAMDSPLVEFLAGMTGCPPELYAQLAVQLPFALARVAGRDARELDHSSFEDVGLMLETLVPWVKDAGISAWIHGDFTVAQLISGASEWLETPPDELPEGLPAVSKAGFRVAEAAVSLWALSLQRELRALRRIAPPAPHDPDEAVAAVDRHVVERGANIRSLLERLFSPAAQAQLLERIGPLGIEAYVTARQADLGGRGEWGIAYRPSDGVSVSYVSTPPDMMSTSSVEWFIADGWERDAAKVVAHAVEKLTMAQWIRV